MRTANEQSHSTNKIYVWDLVVRSFHWITVISFVLAYILVDNRDLHKFFGYTLTTALAIRLAWGFVGSYHAKFWNFIPSPTHLRSYIRATVRGDEPRHLGHNPLGAMMIVALIVMLSAISVTGWMMGLDRYWGEEWVEELHEIVVNITLFLIALHLGGVIYSSLKHKENLVLAMISGWKKKLSDQDLAD